MRGGGNILFGLIFLVGGGSGQLSLIGTDSSMALAVIGVLMLGYGSYQAYQGSQEGDAAAE